jgi:hypothetical protein
MRGRWMISNCKLRLSKYRNVSGCRTGDSCDDVVIDEEDRRVQSQRNVSSKGTFFSKRFNGTTEVKEKD